jgi:hypothetical protein
MDLRDCNTTCVAADRTTNVAEVTLDATGTGRTVTGTYTGALRGEGTGVVGRTRNLTLPPRSPQPGYPQVRN